jgi:hypothetical protein
MLLGYEYRACIKLGAQQLDDPAAAIAEAYQRHSWISVICGWWAGSTTSRFHQASGCGWEDDLEQARQDLDLST